MTTSTTGPGDPLGSTGSIGDAGSTSQLGGTSGTASDKAAEKAAQAKDVAGQVAGTAADEGRHVAGVAADEAKSVAGEATDHVRSLVGEATSQANDQALTQRDRLVGTLRTFSDDLDQMSSTSEASSLATTVAKQLSERTRSVVDHLDGREPSDLLDDVRRFARQRPGTFLLGALAAGVVAGRVARGAKDAQSGTTSSSTSSFSTQPSAYGTPGVPGSATYDTTTRAPGTAGGDPLAGVHGDDPLSAADPALGAQVPPNPTGRYEP